MALISDSAGARFVDRRMRLVRAFAKVCAFDSFKPANDPNGEHDVCALIAAATRSSARSTTQDLGLTMHSPDLGDPAVKGAC
jgi:hypothetical protein